MADVVNAYKSTRTVAFSPATSSILSNPVGFLRQLSSPQYDSLLSDSKWTRLDTETVVNLATENKSWELIAQSTTQTFTGDDCRRRYEAISAAITVAAKKRLDFSKELSKKPRKAPEPTGTAWKPAEFTSWPVGQQKAWLALSKDPNSYYFRFAKPGVPISNADWTEEDLTTFRTLIQQRPANGNWGLFSLYFPTRTGEQCKLIYRSLIREGKRKTRQNVVSRIEKKAKSSEGDRIISVEKQGRDGSASESLLSDEPIHPDGAPKDDESCLPKSCEASPVDNEMEVITEHQEVEPGNEQSVGERSIEGGAAIETEVGENHQSNPILCDVEENNGGDLPQTIPLIPVRIQAPVLSEETTSPISQHVVNCADRSISPLFPNLFPVEVHSTTRSSLTLEQQFQAEVDDMEQGFRNVANRMKAIYRGRINASASEVDKISVNFDYEARSSEIVTRQRFERDTLHSMQRHRIVTLPEKEHNTIRIRFAQIPDYSLDDRCF
uniref:Myb-like domain-containing protein n=1 Tax=Spongospora subterranea TaxID=70186 RepID=A0A0H5R6B8_9EUKA|eukprot:CRZ09693.1 hypothetical protein [Spongospora subterranea]